jgi:cell division protein FtsN
MQHLKAQRGGTIIGFIIGLVIGLGIAVAVALIITKAPVPFINKLAHTPDKNDADPSAKIPDPNKSLYGRDAQNADSSANALGNSTGVLPPNSTVVITAPPATTAPVAALGSNAAATPPVASNAPTAADGKPTLLQAGAFTSGEAAENMKAKLALLGFEAIVSPTTKDGNAVYRVRLGPYSHIDDLNRVRGRLAENGIDASLVPQSR